jgi:hypothetical protein
VSGVLNAVVLGSSVLPSAPVVPVVPRLIGVEVDAAGAVVGEKVAPLVPPVQTPEPFAVPPVIAPLNTRYDDPTSPRRVALAEVPVCVTVSPAVKAVLLVWAPAMIKTLAVAPETLIEEGVTPVGEVNEM